MIGRRGHFVHARHVAALLILGVVSLLYSVPSGQASAQTLTCGVQWGQMSRISFDSVPSINAHIAVTGDTVHLLWYGLDTLGTLTQSGIQYSRSTDGGASFSPERTLLPLQNAFAPGLLAASGPFVYVTTLAAIDTFYGTVLLRSTDAGQTWESPRYLVSHTEPECMLASDSLVWVHYGNLARTNFAFLGSTDNGAGWRVTMPNAPHILSMARHARELDGVGEVGGDYGTEIGYFSALIDGTQWYGPDIISTDDVTPSRLPSIAVNEQGYLYAAWTDTGTIIMTSSRNDGLSWLPQDKLSSRKNAVFSALSASGAFLGVVWDNDFGYGGAIDLRTSNDFADSFCPVDSPTVGIRVGGPDIAIAGKKIHLAWSEVEGGNQEIYYRNGTLSDNPDLLTTPPKEFTLYQNYPNPFNGATHLRYDLPVTSHVVLTLWSVLGQRLATLVDAVQSPDRYDIHLEAENYPSGVYFYRLVTDFASETKKLVITK